MNNVIITGSSSGLGYLTTLSLARKGYKVWATMRHTEGKNRGKKDELLNIAASENLKLEVLEMDITSDQSVKTAVNKAYKTDGKIDILINNAGVMYVGITEAYSLDQVKEQFDTNLFGVIRTVKAVLPHMRKAGKGFITNLSSLAGRLTFPYFGIYCASKYALEAYSEALRYEVAPLGIEISIVEPGPFGTNLLFSGPKESDIDTFNAYGEHKDVPKAMLKNFEGFFQTDQALDPQTVADDVLKLVETKHGQRPIRIVSGIDYGVIDINQKLEPIQEGFIKEGLQMGHLLTVKQ